MQHHMMMQYLAQLKTVVNLVLEWTKVDGTDQARVHGRLRVQRGQQAAKLAAQQRRLHMRRRAQRLHRRLPHVPAVRCLVSSGAKGSETAGQ